MSTDLQQTQPPTLQDIKSLAAQLDVQFSIEEKNTVFDLDTEGAFRIGGTYENSPAGIAIAYGDLRRHQLTLQQVGLIEVPDV